MAPPTDPSRTPADPRSGPRSTRDDRQDDQHRVVRSVGLDCDLDAAWRLVATPEGLDRWMGTDIRLDPVVGGSLGVHEHSGAVRSGRVVEVDPGRTLAFEWAEVGDAASRSTVTITVEEVGEGSSRVTVEERRAGGAVASCLDAGAAWDDRLMALELDVARAGPLGRSLAPVV